MMLVTATDFKINVGYYLSLLNEEDIIVTKNGKRVARLTKESDDLVSMAKSLVGIFPETTNENESKEEKCKRYESLT